MEFISLVKVSLKEILNIEIIEIFELFKKKQYSVFLDKSIFCYIV